MKLLGTRRSVLRRAVRRLRSTAAPSGPRRAVGAPRGVRLEYVRMLDGDRLWLAAPGTGPAAALALRDLGTGTTYEPPDEEGRHAEGVRWVRWHLSGAGLPAEGDLDLELVATGRADADEPTVVEVPPFAATPTTPPPSTDGRWQFSLRRRPDGSLLVRREPAPRRALLVSATTAPGGIRLTCGDPGTTPDLLLLRAGRVEARLPMVPIGQDTLERVLADGDVPPGAGRSWDVAIGSPAAPVAVGRRRNELREPSAAVLMPKLFADTDGTELVATAYSPEGVLRVLRPGRG